MLRLIPRPELKKCSALGLISRASVQPTENGFTPIFWLNDHCVGVSKTRQPNTQISFKRLSSCEQMIKKITSQQQEKNHG